MARGVDGLRLPPGWGKLRRAAMAGRRHRALRTHRRPGDHPRHRSRIAAAVAAAPGWPARAKARRDVPNGPDIPPPRGGRGMSRAGYTTAMSVKASTGVLDSTATSTSAPAEPDPAQARVPLDWS
jgi:hypothetical protein